MPASSTDLPPIRATFNPGPSQIPPAVVRDIQDIAASGLLAESHRGAPVRAVVRAAVDGLRTAMRIPAEYAVVFQPSATAAMEAIVRNLVRRRALHFVNGAFAERFAVTTDETGREAVRVTGATDTPPDWRAATVPADIELIAVTHNETSTGMAWPLGEIAALRTQHAEPLLAVDVTSSFGALATDWRTADVWFGSVQKCLGLPAGLGYLIVGPRALARAAELGAQRGVAAWQDLPVLARKMETGETVETPNVLAIAVLARQMARWDLAAVEAATRHKAVLLEAAPLPWRFHVQDPAWRSVTVHNLEVPDPDAAVRRARAAGFVVGRGYGPLRATCIRVATFPAHSEADIGALIAALGTEQSP